MPISHLSQVAPPTWVSKTLRLTENNLFSYHLGLYAQTLYSSTVFSRFADPCIPVPHTQHQPPHKLPKFFKLPVENSDLLNSRSNHQSQLDSTAHARHIKPRKSLSLSLFSPQDMRAESTDPWSSGHGGFSDWPRTLTTSVGGFHPRNENRNCTVFVGTTNSPSL